MPAFVPTSQQKNPAPAPGPGAAAAGHPTPGTAGEAATIEAIHIPEPGGTVLHGNYQITPMPSKVQDLAKRQGLTTEQTLSVIDQIAGALLSMPATGPASTPPTSAAKTP